MFRPMKVKSLHNETPERARRLVSLSTNSLIEDGSVMQARGGCRGRGLTKRLRCSMNTCKLTSSVKMACPAPPAWPAPYIPADMCVVDGFSFERRKRAWLPPWSQTIYRGMGKRSVSRSWHTGKSVSNKDGASIGAKSD